MKIELEFKQQKIFIDLCFVNFKEGKWNLTEDHGNDPMLAKIHHHGWRTTVRWINGMTVTIPTKNLQEALNIQQINIAASTGNSSRITPNNGETPDFEKLFKLYGLNPKEYINARLIEDIQLAFENKDNPVASIPISYLKKWNNELIKYIIEEYEEENARTTDKENLIKMVKVEGNDKIKDFQIGKYPITQKQWVTIMGNNPSYFKGDNLPVECVSWEDAQKFIKKVNKKTGKQYRLPTEEEWEFAARGGINSENYLYAGSNNLNEVAWYDKNSDFQTHPIGEKKPNELGLYDMTGNVWEWCQDWNNKKERKYHVRRGGSWINTALDCRAAYRSYSLPEFRLYFVGFRLAI